MLLDKVNLKLQSKLYWRLGLFISAKLVLGFFILTQVKPAFAHHPFGGSTPSSFLEGFLSGLGHPIIGLDHLSFVVAIALMALLVGKRGFLLPITFTLAASVGAIIHLNSFDLPLVEPIIAFSVLMVGVLLAWQRKLNLALLSLLSAIAGIFHGFAYGEAIFGAETTLVSSYLLGFTLIQVVISAITFQVGRSSNSNPPKTNCPPSSLRFAGFLFMGIGITFLSSALIG